MYPEQQLPEQVEITVYQGYKPVGELKETLTSTVRWQWQHFLSEDAPEGFLNIPEFVAYVESELGPDCNFRVNIPGSGLNPIRRLLSIIQ